MLFRSMIVPNLSQADQIAAPRLPSQAALPTDPLQRLTFFEGQSQPQGYTGVGNFGSGTDATRGAMPGQSLVTVQVVINANLQTPNPRATLSAAPVAASAPANVPATPNPGASGGARSEGR